MAIQYHDLGSIHPIDVGHDIREHGTPVILPRDDQRNGAPIRIVAQDSDGNRITLTGDLAAVRRELVYHGYTVHRQRGKPGSGRPMRPRTVRLTDAEYAAIIAQYGTLTAALRSLLK